MGDLERNRLAEIASRASEIVGVLAATAYTLGLLSVAGQLREVGLHEPSIIASFSHADVLMKGIGVLLSHLPSALWLALLLILAFVDSARAWVRSNVPVVRRDEYLDGADGAAASTNPVHRLAFLVGLSTMALVSITYAHPWDGVLFIACAYVVLASSWLRGRMLGRGALVATAYVGVVLTGIVGAYLNPPELPGVQVLASSSDESAVRAGSGVHGTLLGEGERGQLYVVVRTAGDDDDDPELQVIDPRQLADSAVLLDEPGAGDGATMLELVRGD